MTTTSSNGKVLYGLYPADLTYEVLERVLFWPFPEGELPAPFIFIGYQAARTAWNADDDDYDNSPGKKYLINRRSDLRRIPLNQLIDDPRRDIVPEYREELEELKEKKKTLDSFFVANGFLDPKRDEDRVKDQTRYKGKSKAEAQREIDRDRASYSSERKMVYKRIDELMAFLQKLRLKRHPLSAVPGLLPFIKITEGPGAHELYRSDDNNIITQIIGDSGPALNKAYTVLKGEIYVTIDMTTLHSDSSRSKPSFGFANDVATFILKREKDKKLRIVKRIVHNERI